MKTKTTFRSLLSMLLTACMLLSMLSATLVTSSAVTYPVDGITGAGTKDDPAVVDSWLEFKTVMEMGASLYITVDVVNFEHTTPDKGYSYLYKNLHYPNGSFITIPAGATKNVKIYTYGHLFKFVAAPDAGNGELKNFIVNNGTLILEGGGKFQVGFNAVSDVSNIFLNNGTMELRGGTMEYIADCAEVKGVNTRIVTNNKGSLTIYGGTFTGFNNATTGFNAGNGAFAVMTGHGDASTTIYHGHFKANNAMEGAMAYGIYNSAQYVNWNTAKLYGGYFHGIMHVYDTGSSMNSLANVLAAGHVYRESENDNKYFNGNGKTYSDPETVLQVVNTKDYIDFSSTPEIESGTTAPSESFELGTNKEYKLDYSGFPEWLRTEGFYRKSGIYAFSVDEGKVAFQTTGSTFNLNQLSKAGNYRISMFNTLYDADDNFISEYIVTYPVALYDDLITEIVANVSEPVIGDDPDYYVDLKTEGVYVSEVVWTEVYGDGQWDEREMEDGDVFEAGKKYYVNILFGVNDGVTVTSDTKAVINGKTCSKVVQTTSEISFNRSFGEAVDIIEITDLVIPNAGDDPKAPLMYELNSSLDCTVRTHEWTNTDGTSFDTFEAGKTYTLAMGIYPVDSEVFENIGTVKAYVNGNEGNTFISSSKKKIAVTMDITIPEHYIEITDFTYPIAGQSANYAADYTFNSSFVGTVYDVEFLDSFGDVFEGQFQSGNTYYVRFTIAGKYPAISGINVTVNGQNADSYQVRVSRDMGLVEHAFTVNSVPVYFTSDSDFFVGGTATIDIEKMAEMDEVYMDGYLANEMNIIWYRNGEIVVNESDLSGASYTFTEADEGSVFYVEVYPYGATRMAVSDKFVVTYDEYEDPSDVMKGDANGDGKVNISDVSLILKFIAKWDVTINEAAANVTGDSKVNISDVSLILKKIAKWDVEFK